MASLGPPPRGGNQNRGPLLVAVSWIEAAIVILVILLRFYARRTIRGIGIDDWVMLFTVVLFLILIGFCTYLSSIGGLRHIYYLTATDQLRAIKFNWIAQPWGILAFATGKISVAFLILRIMGSSSGAFWRKRVLYFIMVSVFMTNSVDCILSFVQCNPPKALWTPELNIPGACWNPKVQSDYAIFMSSWNVFLDAILALFPVTIIWNLKLDLAKRISLCLLMGLGLCAAICGSIKIKFLTELTQRSDFTWVTYPLFVWSISENFVIIICGSIPTLKPLYDRYASSRARSRRTYEEAPSDRVIESFPMRNFDHKDSKLVSSTLTSSTLTASTFAPTTLFSSPTRETILEESKRLDKNVECSGMQ